MSWSPDIKMTLSTLPNEQRSETLRVGGILVNDLTIYRPDWVCRWMKFEIRRDQGLISSSEVLLEPFLHGKILKKRNIWHLE